MTDIAIPDRLANLLRPHPLFGRVTSAINDLTPFLSSELYFFPEYTDHGPAHITSTLAAADYLIPNVSRELLTPDDIAALILATLLHDSAMHLPPDSLLVLLDPKSAWNQHSLLSPLDTQSWPAVFDDFFADARRWDGRTLHNILGDANKSPHEEEDLYQYVKRPAEMRDPDHWPPKYKKFLGEFLRKHHGRLAHEFALHGLPTPTPQGPDTSTQAPRLPDALPLHIRDLAGLIARSHTLPLRDTFDYLDTHHGDNVAPYNIHAVYLMSLLRIADYLQIQSDRVSPALRSLQSLRSPLSNDEWNKHLAVHDIRPHKSDAESLYIHALPESARDFLSLRRLLAGLQSELDTTFAVLGEVYSRQTTPHDLARFSLTLRRVRSNLDNPADYVKKHNPPYYPIQAKFDTAGPDLLKLLIKPLYGDRPEIGIRELLQNALDAVHELRHYCKTHKIDIDSLPFADHEADILISIDKDKHGDHWLTVSDKGIGMTPEVIRDYFLTAGASYRESDAWRKEFADEQGKSKVLRSGRFGIGALAAFLLGPEINLTTRYVADDIDGAVAFEASIESPQIEMRRVTRPQFGTCIRVKLRPHATEKLLRETNAWDWYSEAAPSVSRRVMGSALRPAFLTPSPIRKPIGPRWQPIACAPFAGVVWSYTYAPTLVCNGLRILNPRTYAYSRRGNSRDHSVQWLDDPDDQIPLRVPNISVADPDRKLDLDLDRLKLINPRYSFAENLLRSVAEDFCAYCLVFAPTRPLSAHSGSEYARFYPGFNSLPIGRASWFSGHDGVSVMHPWHLWHAGVRACVWLFTEDLDKLTIPQPPPDAAVVWIDSAPGPDDAEFNIDWALTRSRFASRWYDPFRDFIQGARLALYDDFVEKLEAFEKLSDESIVPELDNVDWLSDGQLACEGKCPQSPAMLHTIALTDNLPLAAEWYLSENIPDIPATTFTRVWQDVMRHPIIPYDPDERRKKFAHAFEVLKEHIEIWQSPNLRGWRDEPRLR